MKFRQLLFSGAAVSESAGTSIEVFCASFEVVDGGVCFFGTGCGCAGLNFGRARNCAAVPVVHKLYVLDVDLLNVQ